MVSVRDDIKIEIGNVKDSGNLVCERDTSDLKSEVPKVRTAPTRSCNLNKAVNYVTPHQMDFYSCDYTAKHSMVKGPNRKLHPVHIGESVLPALSVDGHRQKGLFAKRDIKAVKKLPHSKVSQR